MRDAELIHLFHDLESGVESAEPESTFTEDLYRRLRIEARRSRPGRAVLLAVAAILVTGLVGGALVLGSGILPIPAPSDSPSPSADATASESPASSAAPTVADTSRWVATGDPVNDWWRLGEGSTVTLLPDGKVLMVGELFVPNQASVQVTEVYSPGIGFGSTGTWEATPDTMIQARNGHTATQLADGRVLVTGGASTTETVQTTLGSAELYDPSRGLWSAAASLGGARRSHTATLLIDGRVLVAGGYDERGPLDSAELYDPRTGRWAPTKPMPYGLSEHTATRLTDGRVLLVGGTPTDDPFLFDPISESWTPTAPLTVWGRQGPLNARYNHTATLLRDGRVLVAGGGWPMSDNAEIYDPTAGRWTPTGSMTERRHGFVATLLPDGRVLAAGGGDGGYGGSRTAEVYDPDTGSWTPTRDMLRNRGFHEGTRLADGRVLVVAGYGHPLGATQGFGGGGTSPWAEVYEPGF